MIWQIYILQSESTGQFYIGSTNDLNRRLEEHNRGKNTSTRNKGTWQLVFSKSYETLAEARSSEHTLKKLKSRKILAKIVTNQKLTIKLDRAPR